MGHEAVGIDIDLYIYGNVFTRFHHHLNMGPGISKLNSKILAAVAANLPEIIWVDNRSFLTGKTLRRIKQILPAAKIINVITDDITGSRKSAWRLGLNTASLFDAHFVQRSLNINELKNYGANRVELCYRSFDPSFHRPQILKGADYKKFHTTIGFAGTYEKDREDFVAHLIKNGRGVSVTGDGWPGKKHWEIIKPYYKGPSVYGEDYVKTINGMDIALHFLRHGNRDEQDSRTFEIPACGIFMIAEKSDLHLQLFKDGDEAVFFENKDDMLEKVSFYLHHEAERKRIAANGHRRSYESKYFHEGRLAGILEKMKLA